MPRQSTTALLLGCYAVLVVTAVAGMWFGLLVVPLPWPLTFVLVLLPFGFSVLHASGSMGYRRGLFLMLLTVVVSLLAESVGVLTAAVFGPYDYTSVLGPRFLGLVPYIVPMTWFVLVYPSYVVAEWIVPAGWAGQRRRLSVAGLGATAVTAVDVALDPIMVEAGAWVWHVHGAFFGIPVRNYIGWWLTAFSVLYLYLCSCGIGSAQPSGRSTSFARLATLSYTVFAFGGIGACLHMRLVHPALAGMLATAPWIIAGLQSSRGDRTAVLHHARPVERQESSFLASIGSKMAVFRCIRL